MPTREQWQWPEQHVRQLRTDVYAATEHAAHIHAQVEEWKDRDKITRRIHKHGNLLDGREKRVGTEWMNAHSSA